MDRAPSYLSQVNAERILSEVRPTKLKTETLICINVFLDELLWLVLSTARSFSTDRLKIGLLKALPTTLGKEALLEAEVELKAYWEKTGLHVMKNLENTPTSSPTEFPLQAAFELLRHKCEAYSTLGDLDEDAEIESRLQTRMIQASSNPPNPNAVAPAALYLTAVLEHICEHILGNVARVVGRDASRATAQVQDLYVALCEDETVYSLFKTMKVQEQIERQSQSKSSRSRRSKSVSRGGDASPSRTASPQPGGHISDRIRSSADGSSGLLSPTHGSNSHPPSSADKALAIKMYKNGEKAQSGNEHQRSASMMSEGTRQTSLAFQDGTEEDETDLQDFDDLMRSGTTMKVSLTPDRLKTFEVYNKQKIAKTVKATPPSPAHNAPAPPFKSLRPVASAKSIGRAAELLEDNGQSPLTKRNHSIATPAEIGIHLNPQRRGSDGSTPPQSQSSLLRKASLGNAMTPSSAYGNPVGRMPSDVDMSGGFPKRNRPGGRGPARNRESLDLDDVMDVEDEMAFGPPPMTPKAAAPTGTSSSTRDLIDFLSEGPPELPPAPPVQTNGFDKPAKSGGRLRSMFSRVGSSRQSNEAIPTSYSTSSIAAAQQRGANGPTSLGRSNSSIKKQRSAGNLAAPPPNTQPFPIPAYPRPPNYARSPSAPPSPTLPTPPGPASPETSQLNSPSGERARNISAVSRKAVPPWEGSGSQNQSLAVPSPSHSPRTAVDAKQPPSPKSASTLTPVKGYPVDLNVTASYKDSTPTIQPPTPSKRSGLVPAPRSAGIPNLPAVHAVDVADLRKKLSRATSAPEARLLVDMFLAQWGYPVSKIGGTESPAEVPQPVTMQGSPKDDVQGVGVVEMLLGGWTDETRRHQDDQTLSQPSQTTNISPSPTITDAPLTPASYSTAKVSTQDRVGRVDGKPLPSSGSASPAAGSNGNLNHNTMHHHRYGNGTPVVVG